MVPDEEVEVGEVKMVEIGEVKPNHLHKPPPPKPKLQLKVTKDPVTQPPRVATTNYANCITGGARTPPIVLGPGSAQ